MGAWRDLDIGPSHCKSVTVRVRELFISRYITSRRVNALRDEQAGLVSAELEAGVDSSRLCYAALTGIPPTQLCSHGSTLSLSLNRGDIHFINNDET
jgi:hypothetical protein